MKGYTNEGTINMEMEVADVKRALASVNRLTQAGHKVIFGPKHNYIENIKTGHRTYMENSGKGYRVKVWVPSFTRPGK